MPTEAKHHVSGPLTVAVGLAVTAGFVDAFIYRNVMPVFVANMSGNMIRIGMAAGRLDGHAVVSSLAAVAAFVAAAVVASVAVDARIKSNKSPDPAPLLLAEVFILTVAAIIAVHENVRYSTTLVTHNMIVVALGALAMGIQAIALRRVGQTAVSTTYGTGALVRIGEKIGLGLRKAPRDHGVARRRSAMVLTAVLVAYIAGAATAAAVPLHRSLLGLVPLALLGLAHLAHRLQPPRTEPESLRSTLPNSTNRASW